jgi:hypothetical protein
VSYPKRLPRALYLAGVVRHECTRPAAMKLPQPGEDCCGPGAHDPLYAETEDSRPVDFHSTRRAFCTALAAAGVNVQTAQVLAGHSDPKVHQRYIAAASIRALPDAALPPLPAVEIGNGVAYLTNGGSEKPLKTRAGHGTRTRDPELGKLMLYQLS